MGSPTQTSDSVCGGERRSSGTRELLPQVEAKDVELAHAAGLTNARRDLQTVHTENTIP